MRLTTLACVFATTASALQPTMAVRRSAVVIPRTTMPVAQQQGYAQQNTYAPPAQQGGYQQQGYDGYGGQQQGYDGYGQQQGYDYAQ